MPITVSQAAYDQITALRDGTLAQAAAERSQASTLNDQAAAHEALAQDYADMLDELEVGA